MESTPRPLTKQEHSWVREILDGNPKWNGVSAALVTVLAEVVEGSSIEVKLSSGTEVKGLAGTKGYIGRLDIRTSDNFGITVTLDQHDGRLNELYVDFLDLEDGGDRPPPLKWKEVAHVHTAM